MGLVSDLDDAKSAVEESDPDPLVLLYSYDVNAGFLNNSEDAEEDDDDDPKPDEDVVDGIDDDDDFENDVFILVGSMDDAEKASTCVALHAIATAHAVIRNVVALDLLFVHVPLIS